MAQQIRIALSFVDQRLQEIMLKSKDFPAYTVQLADASLFADHLFSNGVGTLERL